MKGALEDYLKEEREELLEADDIICTLPNVERKPYGIGSSLDLVRMVNSFELQGGSATEYINFVGLPFVATGLFAGSIAIYSLSPVVSLFYASMGTFSIAIWHTLDAVKNRRYNYRIASLLYSGEGRIALEEVMAENKQKLRRHFEEDLPALRKEHILEIDEANPQNSRESFVVDFNVEEWAVKFGKTDEEWINVMASEIYPFLACDYAPPAVERNKDIPTMGEYVPCDKGLIRISEKVDSCDVSWIIAHELVHHCQRPLKKWQPRTLQEGFANAVEHIAVESYSLKAGDKIIGWMGNRMTRELYFMKNAYEGNYVERGEISLYHLGTAAFLAAEKMHGRGIYREIFNAEKPAKLLVEMLGGRQ